MENSSCSRASLSDGSFSAGMPLSHTFSHSAAPCSSRCQKHCLCFYSHSRCVTQENVLILYSCFFWVYPRRPKRKPKIHIKSPAGSMSTGGHFYFTGKGVTPILAYGVKSTWPQGHPRLVFHTNANCVIFGECGIGKEQIARQIYLHSSRAQKPCTVIEAGGGLLSVSMIRQRCVARCITVSKAISIRQTAAQSF